MEQIKTSYTKEMGERYLERMAAKNAEIRNHRSSRYIVKSLERPNEVRAFIEVTGMEYVDVDYKMIPSIGSESNDRLFVLDARDGMRYILNITKGTMSRVMIQKH